MDISVSHVTRGCQFQRVVVSHLLTREASDNPVEDVVVKTTDHRTFTPYIYMGACQHQLVRQLAVETRAVHEGEK